MIGFIILSIILMMFAGYSEGVMDTLAHHYEESIFRTLDPKWWNPVLSGNNKWKDGDKTKGEKFFLSSTLLVGFTEGWHAFKMIRTFSLFASMASMGYALTENIWVPVSIIGLRILFGIVFTIFYKIFKIKTK
jgi:hypothetical protein